MLEAMVCLNSKGVNSGLRIPVCATRVAGASDVGRGIHAATTFYGTALTMLKQRTRPAPVHGPNPHPFFVGRRSPCPTRWVRQISKKQFLGDQNRSTGSIFGFWETHARPAICYNAPMK